MLLCIRTSGPPLYDLTDPKAESRPLDDIAFAADHFAVKLMGLSAIRIFVWN